VTRDASSPGARDRFLTTRWSLVARAGSGTVDAREALEGLCSSYWYPLYAFARRRGLDHHAGQDAVQGFFARLIEKRDLQSADPSRGRFRSFLLAGLSNFLANLWDRERAEKRGGSLARLSIDEVAAEKRYAGELSVDGSPEACFEREWAREVLARSLTALGSEWERAGRHDLLVRLKPFLTTEATAAAQSAIAADLGKTENAIRIALHRMRKRFGELLRLEVADTVADPGEVEAELDDLLRALAS
jgi:DNA-directed RNA polymerase specialized sigma24 family protein